MCLDFYFFEREHSSAWFDFRSVLINPVDHLNNWIARFTRFKYLDIELIKCRYSTGVRSEKRRGWVLIVFSFRIGFTVPDVDGRRGVGRALRDSLFFFLLLDSFYFELWRTIFDGFYFVQFFKYWSTQLGSDEDVVIE